MRGRQLAPVHAVNMAMRPAINMKLTRRTLSLPYNEFMVYNSSTKTDHTVLRLRTQHIHISVG